MRIVVDQQLPPLLAGWLRHRGHDALHVRELGMAAAEDPEIWTFVVASAGVLVTRDKDFVRLQARQPSGAVVWLRVGNCDNPTLIELLTARWPSIETRLVEGEPLIEVWPMD